MVLIGIWALLTIGQEVESGLDGPVHIPDVLAPLLYSGGKWRHNFLF